MPKHLITFHPGEKKIAVNEGENLLQAAMEAGIHINASCGGSATCGKCKVSLLKGVADSPKPLRMNSLLRCSFPMPTPLPFLR
jgi:ferredoxin